MKRLLIAAIGLVVLLGIGACGGGGGGDNTTVTPTGSSNWDQMTWSQDNWA